MKELRVLLLQAIVTIAIAAILMAVVVPQVPALQSAAVGPFVLYGSVLVIFAAVWFVWPRKRPD